MGHEVLPTAGARCHLDFISIRQPLRSALEFDHNSTGFHLNGWAQQAHQFNTTPTDCFSCHVQDFTNTSDPDHVAAGFPTECETRHNPVAARRDDAVFQHPGTFVLDGAHTRVDCAGCHAHHRTAFPLRNSHASLDCESCHTDGFAGTPTDCFSCHADDYNRTRDPDHLAAGFLTTCESWNPSK